MAKNKRNNRDKRREQKRKRRKERKQRQEAKVVDRVVDTGPPTPTLDLPRTDRLLPPVYLTPHGEHVPSPYEVLGIPEDCHDAEEIRAAWLRGIQAHPPEKDPEGARRLREARDWLTDPNRWRERIIGSLRFPDADAWELGHGPEPQGPAMPAMARMMGQAVLYALVEGELASSGETQLDLW